MKNRTCVGRLYYKYHNSLRETKEKSTTNNIANDVNISNVQTLPGIIITNDLYIVFYICLQKIKRKFIKSYINLDFLTLFFVEENAKEIALWLKNNREPFPLILQKWKETTIYRQIFLKNHESDVNITEIVNHWPLYKHPQGYLLVCLILYPICICHAHLMK